MKSSAMTLDRFCGTGITTVNIAAANIMSGMEDMCVAGGTEMMSLYGSEGFKGSPFLDNGNTRLRAEHPQPHQGVCADAIATWKALTAKRLTIWPMSANSALKTPLKTAISTKRWCRFTAKTVRWLWTRKSFRARKPHATICAPSTPLSPNSQIFRWMKKAQPSASWSIKRIRIWRSITSTTRAISSGVVDGAAALLLTSDDYAKAHGMKPRARVVAMANMGDSPTLMLNAPVPAAKKVLDKAGMTLADIDLFEVNEAFSVVTEKFIRDLDIDRDRINVNGGAMALGHPIGATGAILIGTMVDELERQDKQFGLVTMCAAGGMAPAIIIERM